jgi:hypothetical protein
MSWLKASASKRVWMNMQSRRAVTRTINGGGAVGSRAHSITDTIPWTILTDTIPRTQFSINITDTIPWTFLTDTIPRTHASIAIARSNNITQLPSKQ